MFEHTINEVRAILVAVDIGEYDIEVSLAELEELCTTANIEVAAKATQKRSGFDKATFVGSGRIKEIADCIVADPSINLLVFDHELTGSQMRNIEEVVGVSVLDRTMLILDIFAARATTGEGKLQVELAQQKYRLPRLAGPGETKLETDRRHIRTRIHVLEEQLEKLKQHRDQFRKRRKKDQVTIVAIVGYTNVGKSTLLNYLTDAGVLAQDMLFATLDPTSRG
ncbi:MAG: GTPase HflX, partial [Oscillospiraceae bacterium]